MTNLSLPFRQLPRQLSNMEPVTTAATAAVTAWATAAVAAAA